MANRQPVVEQSIATSGVIAVRPWAEAREQLEQAGKYRLVLYTSAKKLQICASARGSILPRSGYFLLFSDPILGEVYQTMLTITVGLVPLPK